MARAYASVVIPVPVDRVWELVRPFDGIGRWYAPVESCELECGTADSVGSVRRVTVNGGALIRERLVELSDAEHRVAYVVLDGVPWKDYASSIQLRPVTADDSTFVEWSATFGGDARSASAVAAAFRLAFAGLAARAAAS
jgi:uncharacterized protein YndB with AHSA1/START domain